MLRLRRSAPALLLGALALVPFALSMTRAHAEPPEGANAEQEGDEVVPDDNAAPSASAPVPSASASASEVPGGMVHITGATFAMGSSDPKAQANERPRHVETVGPFWLDKTEVTVGAYRACVESHACNVPAKSSTWCTYDLGDPQLPVSCVHWRDAEAFCRAGGKRLPRESEWELAARGTKGAKYPWRGPTISCYFAATMVNDTTGRSCTKGPSRVGGHPGGATPNGIFDLAGNLEEWTGDWYVENLAHGAPAAGAAHVLKGGGWQSGPSQARGAARNWGSSAEGGPNVGFRCAKDG